MHEVPNPNTVFTPLATPNNTISEYIVYDQPIAIAVKECQCTCELILSRFNSECECFSSIRALLFFLPLRPPVFGSFN